MPDQFPVQGDDLGHGAAIFLAIAQRVSPCLTMYLPLFLFSGRTASGVPPVIGALRFGNLKLPAGVDPVRVLDPVTVGCHDLGYGAVVFLAIAQRVSPACTV